MNTLRIPVTIVASVAALASASTGFAQETTVTATTTAQPAQPAVVQEPPAATTRTTAAPYVPSTDTSETTIEHRPNRTLLSTGIGIFVVSYGASVVAAAVSDRDADKNLFIPVVGPWLDVGDRGCDSSPCGSREDINKAIIITSGVVQGAGVLMALGSLVMPESTSVTEKRTTAKAKPEVHVTPVSFAAGAGLGAVGRF